MAADLNVSDRWRRWRQQVDLEEYDSRWDRMAAGGASVHDEAELVCLLSGHRILDAGCGTGRVAVELARLGRSVVGVDNDPDMLARAQARSEDVSWVLADLATMELPAAFDMIVMTGDVLHYVRPGDESMAVSNLARHLKPAGYLVSGASLAEPVQLTHYDNWCRAAGLQLSLRYSSWNRAPYDRPGHYAVSIHQRPDAPRRGERRR
ncbi:MAG: class I SAM-dependent methyltransferase [Acidimicrobiia bacterium]|nr:class I SAM-dependent methyltransferase [Acidimicrobiia bacterium]MDH4365344.1 class I SAM-dependent methyltransferase [Acidimicrobiia bacterium]